MIVSEMYMSIIIATDEWFWFIYLLCTRATQQCMFDIWPGFGAVVLLCVVILLRSESLLVLCEVQRIP